MTNREPFWWPMAAPPLPGPYPDYEIGPDWEHAHTIERGRNVLLILWGRFAALFEVEPGVTEKEANTSRLNQIMRNMTPEELQKAKDR